MNKALASANFLHSTQFLKANLFAVAKTFQEVFIQSLVFMTCGISEWGIKTMFILQGVINTNPLVSVSFLSIKRHLLKFKRWKGLWKFCIETLQNFTIVERMWTFR